MQFRWAKVDSVNNVPPGVDTWNLFYQVSSTATNTQPAWRNAGTNFIFNSVGQLSPAVSVLTLNNVTVDGITLGNVSLQFGAGGLTQFANANGTVQVNLLDQNGSPAGQLQSVAVDDQGRVALDALDELKHSLLAGTLDPSMLQRLKSAATELKSGSGEPGLDAVLAEIELRVEVEIAKLTPR